MTATPRFLLDTNILSDMVKHPTGKAAKKIASVGESAICTSIIVASELRYGSVKKGSAALSSRIEALLTAIDVLPLEPGADVRYGEIRNTLEKAGTPIGANDLLIAAQALSLELTLVTDNVREFSRVPGLVVENWLQ